MDFWSRLIGGTAQKQQPRTQRSNPQQRLESFKRTYNSVQQTCSRPKALAIPGPSVDEVQSNLQKLSTALREETRAAAPYLCISFSATSQIYNVVARAALASRNEKIIQEVTAIFNTLVDNEAEHLVDSRPFARSLSRFASWVLESGSAPIGEETEAQVAELLFTVAAKLRVDPDLLPIWFSPSPRTSSRDGTTKEKSTSLFAGTTQRDDFPLCYLFVDRVYLEGRTGDFARTGLIYVFEAASHSLTLEEWIVGSDLPTLMASGLGALYSQLGRELSLLHEPDNMPTLLILSDYVELHAPSNAENVRSDNHFSHIATFLSHLDFWQDVLDHCTSQDVKQTLLDHFQILFLQQLLYPSLLQSSDTDGGSSVAVLTYLYNMFQALHQTDLVQMILSYLLGVQEKPHARPSMPNRSISVSKRRSSLILMTEPDDPDDRFEPVLFNLTDLMLNGLCSQNAQTQFAALKLCSVLLSQHPSHAATALFRNGQPQDQSSSRTVGALLAETEILLGIALDVAGEHGLDQAYTGACLDIQPALEGHRAAREDAIEGADMNNVQRHALNLGDPCWIRLMELLQTFLSNNVDVNLALTEALLALCMCNELGLEGILAVSPRDYQFENAQESSEFQIDHCDMDEDEAAALARVRLTTRRPHWGLSAEPILVRVLKVLQEQVAARRVSTPRFEQMLAKRKAILQGTEDVESQALEPRVDKPQVPPSKGNLGRMRKSSQSSSSHPSPVRPSSAARGRMMHQRNTSRDSISQASSTSSGTRVISSPARFSTNVFRPPPPDSPSSPPQSVPTIESVVAGPPEAELLASRVLLPLSGETPVAATDHNNPESTSEDAKQSVSLSHILTNVAMLQSFVLELAAVMQLRACVYQEVDIG